MFLRASAHAQANGKLREFTAATIGTSADPLDKLHRLMEAIHEEIACDHGRPFARGGAVEALALKKANAGDLAHVFIAAARHLEIPARYVSGYALPASGEWASGMTAWAEALAPDLGWVAFDCAHNLCPDFALRPCRRRFRFRQRGAVARRAFGGRRRIDFHHAPNSGGVSANLLFFNFRRLRRLTGW